MWRRIEVDIRPRTLGEILDDAWRLALADAPLLLLLNTLFLVPAFVVLLLLLAQPVDSGMMRFVLPGLAAVLLPFMGLASGACQELLRRRSADEPVVVRDCLKGALRRGLEHAAARAVLLCGILPGPLLFMLSFLPDMSPIVRFLGFLFGLFLTFLLSFPLWATCFSLHALLCRGAGRTGTLLSELRRDATAAPGKAAALVLSRLPLLCFLALQLHLLAKAFLWAADNLGGFDTTLIDLQLTLFVNPVYTLALFLFSWLLLAPFFECGNFLLHTDIRTRQEGLDLQYQVQRVFAGRSAEPRVSAIGSVRTLMLAVLAFLAGPTMARAEDAQLKTIRAVRQDIETIRSEVQKADPYPGGQRWQGRLRGLQEKLEQGGRGDGRRFRWFEQAITDFQDRKKEDALRTLDDLQRRLSLLEDSLTAPHAGLEESGQKPSPEDIKSLLRGSEGRKGERNQRRQRVEEDRPEARREEDRGKTPDEEGPHAGGGRGTSVSVPAASGGGFSSLGWILLGGMALAVVVLGVILYLASPRSPRAPKPHAVTGTENNAAEDDARQVLEESPAALWRQADSLAGDGRFRDAVRALYLAVLALLHQKQFIRFEPTRTNGEYVRQVRLSEQAPPELHEPFEQLTRRFETAWYGDRPCDSIDYQSCRDLALEAQRLGES
jgi:hypothetical protein